MTEPRRAASAARYLGALSLLAVGAEHIEQYYVDYYRAVPTIGTLFLLNFLSAVVVSAGLLAPLRRFGARTADRLFAIFALSGVGIAAGSLVALFVSENGGLFGFVERGYRGTIVLSIVLEAATVILLGASLVLQQPRRRRRRFLAGAASVLALVIAGCGGSGYGTTAPKASPSAPTAGKAGGGAPLEITTDPRLGKIIVDAQGRTLYDFVLDKGTTSACYGACASLWPPYTTKGAPDAGTGVSASLIGTTKRRDGSTEVTYAGHPLYYFAPDTKRGQITGQALDQFGAPWYALTPAGREIHTPAR